MHEFSLANALLESIRRIADEHAGATVRRVCVRIGELGGVEPEFLRAAYEHLRIGTCCERAELEIENVPARWVCESCGATAPIDGPLQCPRCHAPARLEGGDEVVLQRITLDFPDSEGGKCASTAAVVKPT
ncbi:MAG: hydrogenase maturation nickel metallochaperone HypA [Phycisphaerae bacterium]